MQHIRPYLFASLIGVTGALASAKASVVTLVDVVSVIDGDTVEVKTDSGPLNRVRLLGIDAPENDQAWGKAARKQLKQLIEERHAILWDSGLKDRNGRTLGSLAINETDVGLYLIERGLAWHFEAHGKAKLPDDWNEAYRLAQMEAKYDNVGLWASLRPVPPWTWRKHKYEVQRDRWFTYHDSLEGTSAELQETFSKLEHRFLNRDLMPWGGARNLDLKVQAL